MIRFANELEVRPWRARCARNPLESGRIAIKRLRISLYLLALNTGGCQLHAVPEVPLLIPLVE
jgi:hypothetical protein